MLQPNIDLIWGTTYVVEKWKRSKFFVESERQQEICLLINENNEKKFSELSTSGYQPTWKYNPESIKNKNYKKINVVGTYLQNYLLELPTFNQVLGPFLYFQLCIPLSSVQIELGLGSN